MRPSALCRRPLPSSMILSKHLGDALTKFPDTRLVIVDTLAKFIRVTDLNDYMLVLDAMERLRTIARQFPKLHVMCTAHCKKIRTEDPFDGLLGSTALRAETDTNIAVYGELNQKLIAAETRIRSSPSHRQSSTVILSCLQEPKSSGVSASISPLSEWQAEARGEDQQDNQDNPRRAHHCLSN